MEDRAEDFGGANRALHFLCEASAVLSESLDYEETLETVTYLATPEFAESNVTAERSGSNRRLALVRLSSSRWAQPFS